MLDRYVVYGYDPLTAGDPPNATARQHRIGTFNDRAHADLAAYQAVIVDGKAAGQVLARSVQVYWVDQDDVAAGAQRPVVGERPAVYVCLGTRPGRRCDPAGFKVLYLAADDRVVDEYGPLCGVHAAREPTEVDLPDGDITTVRVVNLT